MRYVHFIRIRRRFSPMIEVSQFFILDSRILDILQAHWRFFPKRRPIARVQVAIGHPGHLRITRWVAQVLFIAFFNVHALEVDLELRPSGYIIAIYAHQRRAPPRNTVDTAHNISTAAKRSSITSSSKHWRNPSESSFLPSPEKGTTLDVFSDFTTSA